MYIIRDGKQIDLTSAEKQMCYQEVLHDYAKENIQNNMGYYLSEEEYNLLKNNLSFLEDAGDCLIEYQDDGMEYEEALNKTLNATSDFKNQYIQGCFSEQEWMTLCAIYHLHVYEEADIDLPAVPLYCDSSARVPQTIEELVNEFVPEPVSTYTEDGLLTQQAYEICEQKIMPVLEAIEKKMTYFSSEQFLETMQTLCVNTESLRHLVM